MTGFLAILAFSQRLFVLDAGLRYFWGLEHILSLESFL